MTIENVSHSLWHSLRNKTSARDTYVATAENMAREALNKIEEDIETIFPGIDLTKQKLNLTPEDLDLFITHAYSHVLALQKELQRLQTDGELCLKWAIDSMRADNDSDKAKDVVNMLY
uniref:MICOS complex subunit MIC60 n=1 Tax=Glossina pallidipes TaxID=7398 RepID=A0A1A9ZGC5_GLOPL